MLAVACTRPAGDRARLVKRARRIIRALRTEDSAWASSTAWMLAASAAHVEGDRVATSHLLDEAARAFDAANMALHATVARWCRASLDGPAPEPQAPVKNFARVVAMFAPPFASRGRRDGSESPAVASAVRARAQQDQGLSSPEPRVLER
jgi:hypothetical protein